jgi:hypothetical protein
MFDYICTACGEDWHTSAPAKSFGNKCPDCGGALAPAAGSERKMIVHLGGTTYEVREADVIEQVRRNYQRSGFVHALRFYRHLRPDDSFEDAKKTVIAWCGNLKEGSVLLV